MFHAVDVDDNYVHVASGFHITIFQLEGAVTVLLEAEAVVPVNCGQ